MIRRFSTAALVALLLQSESAFATQELNADTFKEVTTSGKNGMIKFFQPWCGHCTRMKPDWDKLANEAHSSVFIADINCTDEPDLCNENGVQGYPTIKVYKDGKEEPYNGGRGFEELVEYVDSNLAQKCDIEKPDTCSEKAQTYAAKWKAKDIADVKKERTRLEGMIDKSMTQDLKKWLRERLTVLRQLDTSEKEEL